jgi:hypothetical protein
MKTDYILGRYLLVGFDRYTVMRGAPTRDIVPRAVMKDLVHLYMREGQTARQAWAAVQRRFMQAAAFVPK